jgi:hypothetical protein
MGMPQLVVTAELVEGRTKSEVARDYGYWVAPDSACAKPVERLDDSGLGQASG